jgi:hypothetical protein
MFLRFFFSPGNEDATANSKRNYQRERGREREREREREFLAAQKSQNAENRSFIGRILIANSFLLIELNLDCVQK